MGFGLLLSGFSRSRVFLGFIFFDDDRLRNPLLFKESPVDSSDSAESWRRRLEGYQNKKRNLVFCIKEKKEIPDFPLSKNATRNDQNEGHRLRDAHSSAVRAHRVRYRTGPN
jgi:hypothetical protein